MKTALAIDGGGIRGIIPARVLTAIEDSTGQPAARLFDLIAGTSTGGLLALALCKADDNGEPAFSAAELMELYVQHGAEVFSPSLWHEVTSVGGVIESKYSAEPLEKLLKTYLNQARLGGALTNVLVSAYEIENRGPLFLKSWQKRFENVAMWQAARATTAAPSYFPVARLDLNNAQLALIDGGIFDNNPAVSAYAQAKRLFPEEDDFLVVSLGTGNLTRPIPYSEARDWGKLQWVLPILGVVFDGVSKTADYQMRQIVGKHYYRFQVPLTTASDRFDDASKSNIANLKTTAEQLLRTHRSQLDAVIELLESR